MATLRQPHRRDRDLGRGGGRHLRPYYGQRGARTRALVVLRKSGSAALPALVTTPELCWLKLVTGPCEIWLSHVLQDWYNALLHNVDDEESSVWLQAQPSESFSPLTKLSYDVHAATAVRWCGAGDLFWACCLVM